MYALLALACLAFVLALLEIPLFAFLRDSVIAITLVGCLYVDLVMVVMPSMKA